MIMVVLLLFGKRPHAIRELQRKEPIILARRYQRGRLHIEVRLRRAMVRTTFRDRCIVERPETGRCDRRRYEVSDLARSRWIAYVKDSDSRLEIAARERRCVRGFIDAAVMAAISKS